MGGMAELFLARSVGGPIGVSKFVALKRILPQYSDNRDFIEMFIEEAKLNVNLSHSNIVSIYEFGVERGQSYIIMEYVNGRNLRQCLNKLKKEGRRYFSVDQIVYMIKELSSGLDHAHRCLNKANGKPLNIIHRDISPQNTMLSFDGEIKLIDFGIAKAENEAEKTQAGTLKGKYSYMSPEQVTGKKFDTRTDIFSLGIVFWELLANDRLFTSNNEMNTLKKIREAVVPPIEKLNPNVDKKLAAIVNKSLAKDPDLRYQSASDFYRDLNKYLNTNFPEFSSQDFSVFVKSLYASEIMEHRKKLIDYSKVNPQAHFSNDEQTVTMPNPLLPGENGTQLGEVSESSFNFKSITINEPRFKNRQRPSKPAPTPAPAQRRRAPFMLLLIGILALGLGFLFYPEYQGLDLGKNGMASESDRTLDPIVDTKFIVITSDPPGANITINSKNTGKTTPARVEVHPFEEFELSLRKDGYLEYQISTDAMEKSSFSGTLQKAAIGYLDINVEPADAIVFINGVRLKEKLPIRKYRVPSSIPITIKAVNPISKKSNQTTIKLKSQDHFKINLSPK